MGEWLACLECGSDEVVDGVCRECGWGGTKDAQADYDDDYKWPHEMTCEELLAEMPTEAVLREATKRLRQIDQAPTARAVRRAMGKEAEDAIDEMMSECWDECRGDNMLAEMGGQRVWLCRESMVLFERDSPLSVCRTHPDCGWVWIVKEAEDG